ncbi:MAG: peptide deformylase [bacterium]|nr:peptide deformylase [Acidimicrobiia bacterium]MCY4649346.1 peptide deformylase [bacterium]
MTVRRILPIGHPVLRTKATPVPRSDISKPRVQGLIDDLIDTMRHANGAGIAANQIGEPVRILTVEVNDNPRYPYKPPVPLTVAINPELETLDGETVVINEGCLSVPLRGELVRSVNLRVRYTDREGSDHDRIVRGLTAGTWQHECDHLDGILVVDRIDPKTLSTWEQFKVHHQDAFVERITRFVAEIGS